MVHTFTLDNARFAVDGNSGSIHSLDPIAYQLLSGEDAMPEREHARQKLAHQYTINEIDETYNELVELHRNGSLFMAESELKTLAEHTHRTPAVKSVCLNVAHDCNLRCEYCFASEGDYHSGRMLMRKETALQSVDFLVKASQGLHNIEIDFFGGEPLINFDVVKVTVEYGRSIEARINKRFFFTITTNGTLFNDNNIVFINEHMDNIVISIDGRREIHDALRHDTIGHGSYDRIVPMAQKVVSGRKGRSHFIRGTFTRLNKDFSNDVFHLADLGFREISVEPVVGCGKAFHILEADVPEICAEYERLARRYIERVKSGIPFRFYHFNLDLYHAPCLAKRISACGAGYEYIAVAPNGNIYPCHQFVGEEDYILGNVTTGWNEHAAGIGQAFRENTILNKKACDNCWAKLFCSGGCHANAYFSNGRITEPNAVSCMLQKKRIECAIMVQTALAQEEIKQEMVK